MIQWYTYGTCWNAMKMEHRTGEEDRQTQTHTHKGHEIIIKVQGDKTVSTTGSSFSDSSSAVATDASPSCVVSVAGSSHAT